MTAATIGAIGPHAGTPLLAAGPPPAEAAGVLVAVHGRGGSASDMLGFCRHLQRPDFAVLAPQARGGTWYPNRFLAPVRSNEPHLASALDVVDRTVAEAVGAGVPGERVVLVGFSQGACLALEYAIRHPRRYGGIAGLSGALIGPLGTERPQVEFAGTPVFLGCSDVDGHIPLAHVRETARILGARGAAVDERIYPGFGHSINADEVAAVRALLAAIAPAA